MLLLLFKAGDREFALDVRLVKEVLPCVKYVELAAESDEQLLGIINYRGRSVPLWDLSQLVTDIPAGRRLSTRILALHYPLLPADPGPIIGVLVEKCVTTCRCGVTADGAALLPDNVRLFQAQDYISPAMVSRFAGVEQGNTPSPAGRPGTLQQDPVPIEDECLTERGHNKRP